jgi:hypothetical protein
MAAPKGCRVSVDARKRLCALGSNEAVMEFASRVGMSEITLLRAIAGYTMHRATVRVLEDAASRLGSEAQ